MGSEGWGEEVNRSLEASHGGNDGGNRWCIVRVRVRVHQLHVVVLHVVVRLGGSHRGQHAIRVTAYGGELARAAVAAAAASNSTAGRRLHRTGLRDDRRWDGAGGDAAHRQQIGDRVRGGPGGSAGCLEGGGSGRAHQVVGRPSGAAIAEIDAVEVAAADGTGHHRGGNVRSGIGTVDGVVDGGQCRAHALLAVQWVGAGEAAAAIVVVMVVVVVTVRVGVTRRHRRHCRAQRAEAAHRATRTTAADLVAENATAHRKR